MGVSKQEFTVISIKRQEYPVLVGCTCDYDVVIVLWRIF